MQIQDFAKKVFIFLQVKSLTPNILSFLSNFILIPKMFGSINYLSLNNGWVFSKNDLVPSLKSSVDAIKPK